MDDIDLDNLKKRVKYYDEPCTPELVLKLIDYIDYEAEKRAYEAYNDGYREGTRDAKDY